MNHTALKENTDLRVDRATLQRDLAKVKKQLASSARDAEDLKQQLLDSKARSEKAAMNKQLQDELNTLQAALQEKEKENRRLQDALAAADNNREVEELRDTVEDLEAELREKERLIEAQQDKDVWAEDVSLVSRALTYWHRKHVCCMLKRSTSWKKNSGKQLTGRTRIMNSRRQCQGLKNKCGCWRRDCEKLRTAANKRWMVEMMRSNS